MKATIYTIFALVCFAFNSILCRLALQNNEIDAVSFTAVRLVSGAAMLYVIFSVFSRETSVSKQGNWLSAFWLFAYAICFSVAYINLTTATGALVLFGAVQLTMIVAALFKGERPRVLEWFGLIFAFSGLVCLVFPGLEAPPFGASSLMTLAGIAWGFYTLRGRGSANPLGETAGNFWRAVPFVLIAAAPFVFRINLSFKGVLLAVLSGAVASGIGYAVWYAALKFHTAARAAILQLAVPVIAAVGGVFILAENFSLRLFMASGLILGGIALAISGKRK